MVYVGVIHPYHLPATLLFIQAGKHVLCEKPMGMNAAEVKRMVQAAQEKKVFLMEVRLELGQINILNFSS